jgi:hypothetical protein
MLPIKRATPRPRSRFEYDRLPGSLRKEAQTAAQAIHQIVGQAALHVVQIGLHLQNVRWAIGRENFQSWLRAEFEWSQPVASNFMRAARYFRDCDCLDRLQPSALYILARRKVTDAAREKALSIARRGELITKRLAQEIAQTRTLARQPARRMVQLGVDSTLVLSLTVQLSGMEEAEVQRLREQVCRAQDELQRLRSEIDSRLGRSS